MAENNEEVKKSNEQVKTLDEMTDEEIAKLSGEELVKLSEESPKETDTPAEETGEEENPEEPKPEEKSKEKDEDPFLKSEEYQKYSEKERGLYHSMKDERKKRQDYEQKMREKELEAERFKATSEVQLKYIDKLRSGEKDTQPKSNYERAVMEIEAKAIAYEKETGEEYRPSFSETRKLEQARQADWNEYQRQIAEENAQKQQKGRVTSTLEKIKDGAKRLTESGVNDFDYVEKNIVQPFLRELQASNPDYALSLADALTYSPDPAYELYYHISHLSEEGRKYFQGKEIKVKELIKDKKQIPKTSAHVTGTKTSDGKTKITPAMLDENFDYWHSKLPESKFLEVVEGKDVVI